MASLIDGVVVTPQLRIANPKGDILRAMKRSEEGFSGFGEAYFSSIQRGEVKGWKRHRRMTLNLVVPVGGVRFVIADDRSQGDSVAKIMPITLDRGFHARLTVPPGTWMAFQGLEEGLNLLLNIASEEHDPLEAENADLDRFPFAWKNF